MRYFIALFPKVIPLTPNFRQVVAYDHYSVFSITEEEYENNNPFVGISHEEITELEGTTGWKFYAAVRGYRSAYSDQEGLEPDPESLAKGKRKTKVYPTPEEEAAAILLMKRILKRNIADEYARRVNRTGEEELLAFVDSLNTMKELCFERERLIGVEMYKSQLLEMDLWDVEDDSRKGRMVYDVGF